MSRPHVIIHPYDMAQSDWVRCILPSMQFMCPNPFGVNPSVTRFPCTSKDALKNVRAIILQKSNAPGNAQIAAMYYKVKKECGFKLVTDIVNAYKRHHATTCEEENTQTH